MNDNLHDGGGDRAALSAIVEEFFDRMADNKRRGTVGDLFSETAVLTLSGARFEDPNAPEEMLAFFATRYEWAAKDFDRWYIDSEQGVVVSVGTLYDSTMPVNCSRLSATSTCTNSSIERSRRWTSTTSSQSRGE